MLDDSPIEKELSAKPCGLSELSVSQGRVLAFMAVAFLLGAGLCWSFRGKNSRPETGTITGRATPLVSDWQGRIQRFWVKSGDSVQVGEPIAVLVNEQLQLQIARSQREVGELQDALQRAEQNADVELTRQLKTIDAEIVAIKTERELLSAGKSEPADLSELETLRIEAAHRVREKLNIGKLRAELLGAEAKLRVLHAQPRFITLPAPVSGIIGKVLRKPGERVVEGTPLLELANQNQPYLVVEMPEPIAKHFALGDTVPLNFPGQESNLGRVANMQRIKSAGGKDAANSKMNVRLEIEPLDGDWPAVPLKSAVRVRTSDCSAMSRRVN